MERKSRDKGLRVLNTLISRSCRAKLAVLSHASLVSTLQRINRVNGSVVCCCAVLQGSADFAKAVLEDFLSVLNIFLKTIKNLQLK